jgi:death-on-curing protein
VISEEKLQAAIDRPQASAFGEDAYPTLADKAAALLQSIVIGHPFMDGNKRAGLGACLLFLALNGVPDERDPWEMSELVLAISTGELREVSDIAERLRVLFAPDLD